MSELDYGVQLYSLHDFTEADLGYALSRLPEFGYKSVEFAGFFGHTADEINEMLSKNGLRPCGSHIGLYDLSPEKIDETVAFHKAIGCPDLVIASADVETAAGLYPRHSLGIPVSGKELSYNLCTASQILYRNKYTAQE